MLNNLKLLTGYDPMGTVYDAGECILRRIVPDYLDETVDIFNHFKKYEMEKCGFVETELAFSETFGERVLKHKKHVITYPYEWTANMYKDAVLFHLELFSELDKYEYTLKDATPNNIVFKNCSPVFVDFLSLTKKVNLSDEKWLMQEGSYSDSRYVVLDKMFLPFMLIPLIALGNRDYPLARTLLSEKACNCGGGSPGWHDLYPDYGTISLKKKSLETSLKNIVKKLLNIPIEEKYSQLAQVVHLFKSKDKYNFIDFIHKIFGFVNNIDVTPTKSNYLSYYEDKNEKFSVHNQSEWTRKQKNIYKILDDVNPGSVLDLGANTGWFSILAEKMGAEVISVDIDESSIDNLYLYAKDKSLKIVPLKMSFDDLTKEFYGASFDEPEYEGRDFQSNPLFLPAIKRLKSEMVFVLGLVHHLTLGEGKEIEEVLDILSELTGKTLVLEFVGLIDNMIQDEPSFFKNLNKYTEDTYNLEVFIQLGKKYFKEVEVLDSHPSTRKLLVFRR